MAIDYGSGIAQFNPYVAQGPVVPQLTNTNSMDFGATNANGGIMDVIAPGGTNYFPTAPGAMGQNGSGGFLSGLGLSGQGGQGFNWGALGNIANLIGGFGSLYSAFQGAKIAKESLALQREAFQTNLANQRKSYNTALTDRAKTRGVMEGTDAASVDKYIADNSL